MASNNQTSELRPLIIWGAGGLAKALLDFMPSQGWEIIAIFDNNLETQHYFLDVPLFHGKEGFARWKAEFGDKPVAGLVAIGGGNSRGRERLALQGHLETHGVEIVQAINPTAYVAKDSVLGNGCQILAQAAICTEVRLGAACIIQTSASVDHESTLGDGVNLSPGVRIAGCVHVGSFTQFGVGSIVLPRIKIGSNVTIGAGVIISQDVPDDAVIESNK